MYPTFGCCISILKFVGNSSIQMEPDNHLFINAWLSIWMMNPKSLHHKNTSKSPSSIHVPSIEKPCLAFGLPHTNTYVHMVSPYKTRWFFQVDFSMVSPPLFPKTMSVCNVSPTSKVGRSRWAPRRGRAPVVTWWSDHPPPIFYKPWIYGSYLEGVLKQPQILKGTCQGSPW